MPTESISRSSTLDVSGASGGFLLRWKHALTFSPWGPIWPRLRDSGAVVTIRSSLAGRGSSQVRRQADVFVGDRHNETPRASLRQDLVRMSAPVED